jgi:hypothetical protein
MVLGANGLRGLADERDGSVGFSAPGTQLASALWSSHGQRSLHLPLPQLWNRSSFSFSSFFSFFFFFEKKIHHS